MISCTETTLPCRHQFLSRAPNIRLVPNQESTFTLAPAMGKKCPPDLPELPRSSSSDPPSYGRMRGGTSEVFPEENDMKGGS